MNNLKRGVTLFAIFLFSVSIALAAHSATVSTDYVPIYETTGANVSVTVSNSLLSSNSIGIVNFLLNGFGLLSAVDVGWDADAANNSLTFTTSDDRIGRWGSQTFGFEIIAGNVDSNQTVEWPVTTTDSAGDAQTNTIQLLIINDDSAPVISDVMPQNGSFIMQGISDQEFSLTAVDAETGISSVGSSYGICGNLSNLLSFENANDSYYTTADLSAYADSTVICYNIDAQSNGGEVASAEGQFTIDGVAPEVELLYPDDSAMLNNNSLFSFTATDNLAPTLECAIFVDDEQADSAVVANGDTAEISVDNIPEGEHSWMVSCTDPAGNEGVSESRIFTLDKTPPVINVTSPSGGSVNKAGIPVEVEVTDNFGVDEIWYEFQNETYTDITSPFSINTDNATDGPNLIAIHATDAAGNEAELDYILTIDKQAPSIDLISPVENGTFDVHVPFILTVTDNYDPLLDCSVFADGELAGSFQAENGNVTQENVMIDVGMRAVSVQCSDDADNTAQTPEIMIDVKDLTGPDIAIEDILTAVRGEAVTITATITDYSGVDSAEAILTLPDSSTEPLALSRDGDVFTGQYATDADSQLGEYAVTITANDTNGMESAAMASFDVINGYIITLSVTSPVHEGDTVTVSGTAQRDDGQSVPGDEINLVMPSGNETLTLDNNSFSTSFSAPSPGTYEIMAYIDVDNRTFSQTANLEVQSTGGGGGGNGGSGSNNRHSTVVMPDINVTEEEPQISYPQEVVRSMPSEPEPVEVQEEPQPVSEDVGVGKAGGFLNLENIKWSSLLWIILGIAAVALVIKMLAGNSGSRRRKRGSNFDLDRYLESRRR